MDYHQINYLKSNKLLQNRNIFTMIMRRKQELSHYFEGTLKKTIHTL